MNKYTTKQIVGEFSGAFADLGTFLPIVIAVLTLQLIDPSGLFIGFGLFALAVAAIYRRPIPVQPMKAVAAVVIAENLSAGTISTCGPRTDQFDQAAYPHCRECRLR